MDTSDHPELTDPPEVLHALVVEARRVLNTTQWEAAEIFYRSSGLHAWSCGIDYDGPDGPASVTEAHDVSVHAARLRRLMWTPQDGTWFDLTVHLDSPTAEPRFEYDYESSHEYDPTAEEDIPGYDENYVEALEAFPRPWEKIPQWHPARRLRTENQWNALLATRGDTPPSPRSDEELYHSLPEVQEQLARDDARRAAGPVIELTLGPIDSTEDLESGRPVLPTRPLTQDELDDAQGAVVQAAAAALEENDPEWTRAEIVYSGLAALSSLYVYDTSNGERVPLRGQIVNATFNRLRSLQAAMWGPETGTWLSVLVTLDAVANELRIEYNWDDEPTQWAQQPTLAHWIDDITTFTRPWDAIPDWHPIRTLKTREEWDAFLARRADASTTPEKPRRWRIFGR